MGGVVDLIRPMLATAGDLPREPAGWAFEMKWDGVRAIVYFDDGAVRLYSRNDRDVSVSYPELQSMGDDVSGRAVLDGEIVALDASGRPSFGTLQQRMHVADPVAARRLAGEVPAIFFAFDLLQLGDVPLLEQTYVERRELLERLGLDGPSWQTPPVFEGGASAAMAASHAARLEGVVAKRLTSRYRPGARSRDWIKVKNLRTQEVVIGGWRSGEGRRSGTVGALLMGVPEPDGLGYAGKVGTGFTDAMLVDLQHRLEAIAIGSTPFSTEVPRPDARAANWVRPLLVGEVAYGERTGDGRLRHPVWRGLRPDKSPEDVGWELS
jgi:bifunctional non-homologous end joining protein LigD